MSAVASWDPDLESLLVCPADGGPLEWHHDARITVNPRLRRAYPIQDGIPRLVVAASFGLDDDRRPAV